MSVALRGTSTVEVAQELRVVVGPQGPLRTLRPGLLRPAQLALHQHHAAIDGECDNQHDQQELEHPSTVAPGATYPVGVKEFLVYTGLRALLFVSTAAILLGAVRLITGELSQNAFFVTLIAAFLVSGIAAIKLLEPQRLRFARRVEDRASAAAAKFDGIRSKED